MCGRYGFAVDPEELRWRYEVEGKIPTFTPRYNVAPTQTMPVVVRHSPTAIALMRWGLLPFWAKDEKMAYKTFNARAETVAEKPSYRQALKEQRCLIPASGFYEWKKTGEGKQPCWIFLKEQPILSFAGPYSQWRDPEGTVIGTYTIITTEPNTLMAPIHNRMPVILTKEGEEEWLNPDETETERLTKLLIPYDDRAMDCYPVSTAVNSARGEDTKDLIRPMNSE